MLFQRALNERVGAAWEGSLAHTKCPIAPHSHRGRDLRALSSQGRGDPAKTVWSPLKPR